MLLLAGVVVVVARRTLVVVDETEFVVVTEFGRPVSIYGDEAGEAGPHVCPPWRSSFAVDRRLHVFEPPPRGMITADKRGLEVSSCVLWRVRDPLRFLRAAATAESAEARLGERVAAAMSVAVGRRGAAALASVEPGVWALDEVTKETRDAVAGPALDELGVEVVDVRLTRFSDPVEVRPAIFDLIRAERRQAAAALRAAGDAEARGITARADRDRDERLAAADADAERIRGRAEAEAARITNAAHARDPRFAEFLRTLDAYRGLIDERATVVLSSSSPLLRLLTRGPAEELMSGAPRTPIIPTAPGSSTPLDSKATDEGTAAPTRAVPGPRSSLIKNAGPSS